MLAVVNKGANCRDRPIDIVALGAKIAETCL